MCRASCPIVNQEEEPMARPVTLFTGQWADVPLEDLAEGPLSIEWEDSGMDRDWGAPDALAFVRRTDFSPSSIAFDATFAREA
jgi:hypothetical protein